MSILHYEPHANKAESLKTVMPSRQKRAVKGGRGRPSHLPTFHCHFLGFLFLRMMWARIAPSSLEGKAEAYSVVAERRRVVAASRDAAILRGVEPTAATIHAAVALFPACRV